jgi:hypothetical protein
LVLWTDSFLFTVGGIRSEINLPVADWRRQAQLAAATFIPPLAGQGEECKRIPPTAWQGWEKVANSGQSSVAEDNPQSPTATAPFKRSTLAKTLKNSTDWSRGLRLPRGQSFVSRTAAATSFCKGGLGEGITGRPNGPICHWHIGRWIIISTHCPSACGRWTHLATTKIFCQGPLLKGSNMPVAYSIK